MADSLWQEKSLIRRFNRGDRQVLRQMYETYRLELMTLASALVFDRSAAEDVIHEVFARMVERRDRIRVGTSLRGYLFRAVANTARNANRSRRRTTCEPGNSDAAGLSVLLGPDEQAMWAEQCERLIPALAQLPYEQREVVLLRHYAGLRFREIAKSQGQPIPTVQGRYRYAMEKLRSFLGGDP